MRSKNKSFWEKFKGISLYVFAVVTLLFGSGLVWKFCENEKVAPQEEEKKQPKEKQKEQDSKKEESRNDAKVENLTKIVEPTKTITTIRTIECEGFGEDMFDKDEARKLAIDMATNNLISKFPKEKGNVIRRYAKIEKDTVEKTEQGTWKAYIVLSVNESEIIN